MRRLPNCFRTTILSCLISFLPGLAFGQAGIVSEREKIVSYSAEDLNPAKPGYEWEGATLLKNIRVIDGLGNRPKTGQDLWIADGKIRAVGMTGSLDVPADAKIVDGAGLTVMPD